MWLNIETLSIVQWEAGPGSVQCAHILQLRVLEADSGTHCKMFVYTGPMSCIYQFMQQWQVQLSKMDDLEEPLLREVVKAMLPISHSLNIILNLICMGTESEIIFGWGGGWTWFCQVSWHPRSTHYATSNELASLIGSNRAVELMLSSLQMSKNSSFL